jgi:hypothetical protein
MPRKARGKTELTQARLKELLSYDSEAGHFTWLQNRGFRAVAGARAGYKTKLGYIKMHVDLKLQYAHRLAWLYTTGHWPTHEIDHINGDPSDNRIANLREATRQQNTRNQRIGTRNKSGYKGASWNKRDGVWRAFISRNGKTRHLGTFETAEQAHSAYCRAAKELAPQFWRAK